VRGEQSWQRSDFHGPEEKEYMKQVKKRAELIIGGSIQKEKKGERVEGWYRGGGRELSATYWLSAMEEDGGHGMGRIRGQTFGLRGTISHSRSPGKERRTQKGGRPAQLKRALHLGFGGVRCPANSTGEMTMQRKEVKKQQ